MEVERQIVQAIRRNAKDAPYLLQHSNTWEAEEDISTYHTGIYFSEISHNSIIKVEEIEGEMCDDTTWLTGSNIPDERRICVSPVTKKEDVVHKKKITEEGSTKKKFNLIVKRFSCGQ